LKTSHLSIEGEGGEEGGGGDKTEEIHRRTWSTNSGTPSIDTGKCHREVACGSTQADPGKVKTTGRWSVEMGEVGRMEEEVPGRAARLLLA
jgi:hypothetical protein